MEPTLAEVTFFAGNFAPRAWANCEGQILPINQNQSLYSLLGTTYGGDGRTSFALPDLRGRMVVGQGDGSGLTNRPLGQKSGQETVTLTIAQIPSHTHTASDGKMYLTSTPHNSNQADNNLFAKDESNLFTRADSTGTGVGDMASGSAEITLINAGGGQAHENMPPFQVLRPIICLQGLFPSRN